MDRDQVTPLVGRKRELADLHRLVRGDRERLVTITGPTGIGKTRLATELVAELADVVELVFLDDVDPVTGAASVADARATNPDAHVVVTSEAPLRVEGEREYRLRPLAEAPAVELFRRRAEAVSPGFAASYAEIAERCAAVGRVPLAIERAAVQAASLR